MTVTRKEKKQSMVDIMRQRIEKSAGGGQIFFKISDGEKKRVRFLTELTDATMITMHDKYSEGVNFPCPKYFGKKCPICGDTEYRTRDKFVLALYDYEAKEIKIMMEAANDMTPVPHLINFYEEYGTILDRDFIIKRKGKQLSTSYTLIPGAEGRFKGAKKFKALTEDEIFEKLEEKYGAKITEFLKNYGNDDDDFEDDDYEEETPKKKKVVAKNKAKNKAKAKVKEYEEYFDDDEDYEDDEDDEDEDEDDDYDDDEDDYEEEEEEIVKPKKAKSKRTKKRK